MLVENWQTFGTKKTGLPPDNIGYSSYRNGYPPHAASHILPAKIRGMKRGKYLERGDLKIILRNMRVTVDKMRKKKRVKKRKTNKIKALR